LVTVLPIGSSITMSSAMSDSQPSRSWVCTHRQDANEAAMAGVKSVTLSAKGLSVCSGISPTYRSASV
jgi:hypothetical protein